MIRDARFWAVRLAAFRTLPGGLPASVVVRLDSRDLDILAAAAWSRGTYERTLASILRRIATDPGRGEDQAA